MTVDAVLPRMYAAMRDKDVPALLATLDAGFRGRVTDGLPAGIGGVAAGPEEMLRDVWGRAFQAYDLYPEPEEYLEAADGRVVVLGWYVGTARASGAALRARFAHVLRVASGRITELEQITDSARWAEALTGP